MVRGCGNMLRRGGMLEVGILQQHFVISFLWRRSLKEAVMVLTL